MFCLRCGANNVDGAQFCSSCGTPLVGASPLAGDAPQGGTQAQPWGQPQQQPQQPQQPTQPQQQPQPWGQPQPDSQMHPDSWGQSPVQEPPQEWPSGGVNPVQGGGSPKKPRTGLIVGIVVGVVVLAIAGVVAFLFLSGTLGGKTSDQEAIEQKVADEKDDADDKDGESDDKDADKDDDKDADKDESPVIEATGTIDETVFDLGLYEQDLVTLEASLEDCGLTIQGSTAFHYDDMEDSLYVSFTGTVDEAFPVEGSSDEVEVSVYIEAEDFAFEWDEDDYASDVVTSLAELPEDSAVSMVEFSFESDVEVDDFPAEIAAILDAMSAGGDVASISGTSSELVDEACALMDISEDVTSINIIGGMSYDSLYLNYNSGLYVDVTRFSMGSSVVSISYYC